MRQTDHLNELEFTPSKVKVTDWDLRIPIAPKAGPFCQLAMEPTEASGPGVFAWVVADKVVYLGHTDDLSLVGHPRGDFASVTASTSDTTSARINNLLNAAFKAEHRISLWWRQEITLDDAAGVVTELVAELEPMGNQLTRRRAPGRAKQTTTPASKPATRKTAAPKPSRPAKYDHERVTPKNLVCPSCFIQVPLTTGWCDDCEIQVG